MTSPREGAARPTAKHGTELMTVSGDWVRLIRNSVDEDGSPMRIWFDIRPEDLLELAELIRESGPSHEGRSI